MINSPARTPEVSGQIPLGGGHFFDPTTGQIIFNPAAAPGGAAGLVYGGSPRLL